jgi:hypothetical protein
VEKLFVSDEEDQRRRSHSRGGDAVEESHLLLFNLFHRCQVGCLILLQSLLP